ncbi:MAG: LysR family transcriptional regulator [Euryarchaeota archaeon]|nr:LysR family transcriptional regulator [Euryarchaeota archaeon]
MRIDYLATLKTVVKEGSLLKAARTLDVSVSTISSQISSVEKFFDIAGQKGQGGGAVSGGQDRL